MKKTCFVLLLACLLVLCGCGRSHESDTTLGFGTDAETVSGPEETVPATIPADGDPNDVTCKGSYTAGLDAQAVVATAGDAELTNSELQVWYWAEVAEYRQAQHEIAPDFDAPLDTQTCQIDTGVASWQQYFLKQALNAWHSAQALVQQSRVEPLPTEEAYQPNLQNYEIYLTGMPATKYLYRYNPLYQPNTMHQEYLDNLPEMLKELAGEKGYSGADAMADAAFGASGQDLTAFAEDFNLAYMYFTTLSYYIEPTEEEIQAFYTANRASYTENGKYVDIRHILLVPDAAVQDAETSQSTAETTQPTVPDSVEIAADGTVTCSEAAWTACETQAQELLESWQKKTKATEATFAEIANQNSDDTGTALDGGSYRNIRQGQLMDELDAWCFDASRQPGDTTILRSDYGVHILYFSGSTDIAYAEAEEDYYRQQQTALITAACETYPMEVSYSAITLSTAEGTVAAGDILYPDVAHERFPEVPLYLQQDYPKTMYGGFKITSNGCGITSMAMLASYMTDDELTPPEMCARYGSYSHSNGTDGMIFNYEPAVMGFYLKEKTYDTRVAKAALEEGHIVISIQHPGYWTRGGHYIVCESINEDDMVQVRDSNIYNYGKLHGHKEDLHSWGNIVANGSGYWIFEYKITSIPACIRCGEPEGVTESLLTEDYYCEKCEPAMLRRETYLNA